MTRRFRLRPVSVGDGGFAQTLILPPVQAPRIAIVETQPGPDCSGVADPPTVLEVTGLYYSCGPDEWPALFSWSESVLPAGYEPWGPPGGSPGDRATACLDEEPTGWLIRRECDQAVLQIPVNVTYEGGA